MFIPSPQSYDFLAQESDKWSSQCDIFPPYPTDRVSKWKALANSSYALFFTHKEHFRHNLPFPSMSTPNYAPIFINSGRWMSLLLPAAHHHPRFRSPVMSVWRCRKRLPQACKYHLIISWKNAHGIRHYSIIMSAIQWNSESCVVLHTLHILGWAS